MASANEKLRLKIQQAIQNSSEVPEGNYVTVGLEKEGFLFFGKSKIVLTGRTTSEKVKETVESIAKEVAGDAEVESRLRVGKVS
jgi:osmotically-inducible protein OsmY